MIIVSTLFCVFYAVLAQEPPNLAKQIDNELATVCRPHDRALDVLVILDGSGSVSGTTFTTQVNMVRRLVDIAEFGANKTKLAVLQYAGYTKVEFDFNRFKTKEEIHNYLNNIRIISGTTRTGKALKKAYETFRTELGARLNRQDVAQVLIVVTDGHSQDDPYPAAEELRNAGVIVLAVGIGEYVNDEELLEITKDPLRTFDNASLGLFEKTFQKIAIGEFCQFAKGPNGAEVLCGNDSITVNVLTKNPFKGHLYVKGYYRDPVCVVKSSWSKQEGREINLRIPMTDCGMRKQYLLQPRRGLLFETAVVLMFHNEYNTVVDKTFPVRCFYPENNDETVVEIDQPERNQTLDDAPTEENGAVDSATFNVGPPCYYTLHKRNFEGCLAESALVGDILYHRWECDPVLFQDYDMLVHSCFASDENNQSRVIIDENGCSSEPLFISTPVYAKPTVAQVASPVVKFADSFTLKFRCSIKLCNRLNGQCSKIVTPPTCLNDTRTRRDAVAAGRPTRLVVRKPSSNSADSSNPSAPVPAASVIVPVVATADEPKTHKEPEKNSSSSTVLIPAALPLDVGLSVPADVPSTPRKQPSFAVVSEFNPNLVAPSSDQQPASIDQLVGSNGAFRSPDADAAVVVVATTVASSQSDSPIVPVRSIDTSNIALSASYSLNDLPADVVRAVDLGDIFVETQAILVYQKGDHVSVETSDSCKTK